MMGERGPGRTRGRFAIALATGLAAFGPMGPFATAGPGRAVGVRAQIEPAGSPIAGTGASSGTRLRTSSQDEDSSARRTEPDVGAADTPASNGPGVALPFALCSRLGWPLPVPPSPRAATVELRASSLGAKEDDACATAGASTQAAAAEAATEPSEAPSEAPTNSSTDAEGSADEPANADGPARAADELDACSSPFAFDLDTVVTPDHVFARLERFELGIDRLLAARGVEVGELPSERERDLEPAHAFQMMLSCLDRFQLVQRRAGLRAIPTIVTAPRAYEPRDVHYVATLMVLDLELLLRTEGLAQARGPEVVHEGKRPADVFHAAARVHSKLGALLGLSQVTPDVVFAQVRRSAEDVRSILRQADPACRYRVRVPEPPASCEPRDVLALCLRVREQLNDLRVRLGLPELPLPDIVLDESIRPIDPFLQSQVLIAEIGRIKVALGTVGATPLPIPVTGKRPVDVLQELRCVQNLVAQIDGRP